MTSGWSAAYDRLDAYLEFDGQCQEAFKFYQSVLGGKITAMMPFEGSPSEGHVPPEWRSKTMHAQLDLGDDVLMGSDGMPGKMEKPQGFNVSIQVQEPAEAERIFNALADGGDVVMAIDETFWAYRFGMLTDRFGTPWMVNCSKTE